MSYCIRRCHANAIEIPGRLSTDTTTEVSANSIAAGSYQVIRYESTCLCYVGKAHAGGESQLTHLCPDHVARKLLSRMPLLWTINNEIEFHRAIVQLSKLRQTPPPGSQLPASIPGRFPILEPYSATWRRDSTGRLHVAFLAHRSEGFAEIAAVCIEEQPNHQGLIIRLARNELQQIEEVESIRVLLRVLEDWASEGMLAVLREVRQ